MYRRNKFGIGLRAMAIGLGVSCFVMAQADQWDLGSLTFNFTSFNPGLYGDPTTVPLVNGTWKENDPSSFVGWAGGINWNVSGTAVTVSGVPSTIQTICSSFNQDFSPGNGAFTTELYSLNNATAQTTTITLGNGTTVISLPPGDLAEVPPETGTSFLQGAALFGKEFGSASASNNDAAALQLAIWQVLYQNQPELTPTMGPLALNTREASYVAEASTFTAVNNYGGWLSRVQWANYTGGSTTQGQGQFRPAGTPEPFTLALGAVGLVVAARRRMKARKA